MQFKNLRAIREDRDIKQKQIAECSMFHKTLIRNMRLV